MNDTTTATVSAAGQNADAVPPGSIIVGHDGSKDADHALEVALDFASKLGVDIVAVRTWSIDTAPHGVLFDHGYVSSFDEVTAKVRAMLVDDTERIAARYPGVALQHRAALAQPAQLLAQLSSSALMLVVGSRGLGGFAGLLLGSVSSQCTQLATCPVLVVQARTKHRG